VLCVGCDASIRIESTDNTVGLLKDLSPFFDEWLDGVNQLLFIKVFLRLSLCSIDGL
jgi:hypothetical protein